VGKNSKGWHTQVADVCRRAAYSEGYNPGKLTGVLTAGRGKGAMDFVDREPPGRDRPGRFGLECMKGAA